jgi:glutamine synthetase
MAMLDGIKAALEAKKTPLELEKSISKKYGEDDFYLDTYREYRSEKNVFLDYTPEERDRLFGHAPRTVWENIEGFNLYPEKTQAISCGGVIPTIALLSFADYAISQWATELHERLIPEYGKIVKSYKMVHDEDASAYDIMNWKEIDELRRYIAKDDLMEKSLLTKTREALEAEDYPLASKLQLELQEKISLLRDLYIKYKRNLF